MAHLTIHPARCLQGRLTLPGDKSISHRALVLGALSEGTTRIFHWLKAKDVESTILALRALGVSIQEQVETEQAKADRTARVQAARVQATRAQAARQQAARQQAAPEQTPRQQAARVQAAPLVVEGRGLRGLTAPKEILNVGNSGTTARFLLGILAGQRFKATLTGDDSLVERPMRRVTEPLERMGARFEGAHGLDRLPLTVHGGSLRGIRYTLPVASAQVKSALLLAGLFAEGPTTVEEPIPTRDHTERMLKSFGAKLTRQRKAITISPGAALVGQDLTVPGDFSSAAFFLVAATVVPGSHVVADGVGLNPTRTGLLAALRRMGGQVEIRQELGSQGWEPWGRIEASHASLKAIRIDPKEVPMLIDELPVLMVAATQAKGVTRIESAAELRVKETDRIRSMVEGLTAMGTKLRVEKDTLLIEGPTRLRGARVRSYRDHRTAMALAVAGLVAEGPTTIEESEWVDISFPEFSTLLASLRH